MQREELLKQLLRCSEWFKDAVVTSFGPFGHDQLVVDKRGNHCRLLVSSCGCTIIEALKYQSRLRRGNAPGRLLLDILLSFNHMYGDGMSGVCIMVNTALSLIAPHFHQEKRLLGIRKALEQIRYEFFNAKNYLYCMLRDRLPISRSRWGKVALIGSNDICDINENYKDEVMAFVDTCSALTMASLKPQFSSVIVKELTDTIRRLIQNSCLNSSGKFNLRQILQHIADAVNSNVLVLSSPCIEFEVVKCNSFLLDRPPLHRIRCQHSARDTSGDTRGYVLILDIPLFERLDDPSYGVVVTSANDLSYTLGFQANTVSRLISNILSSVKSLFKGEQFIVLACTYELPDPSLTILESFGAWGIQCIKSSDSREICALAKVQPITNIETFMEKPENYIFSSDICEIDLGNQAFAVRFDNFDHSKRTSLFCNQVIIHSPSLELGKQYKMAIARVMKMLVRWLNDKDSTIIPGGCAAEFALYAIFCKKAKQSRLDTFSMNGCLTEVYALLSKTVLALPLALLANSKAFEWNGFLMKLHADVDADESLPIQIVCGSGEFGATVSVMPIDFECLDHDCDVIQPLASVIDQLSTVIDTLIQLLRIDCLVRVK